MNWTAKKISLLGVIGKPLLVAIEFIVIGVYFISKVILTLPRKLEKLPKRSLHSLPQKSIKHTKKITPKLNQKPLKISFSKSLFIFLGLASFLSTFVYLVIIKDLPSPKELRTKEQIVSTKIYDRNGELLYKIFKNENRTLTDLDSIPRDLINATIAIEDQDFYDHTGISIKGIGRAIKRNLVDQKVQGGSTITQQLVKNTLLTSEKTFTRKIKELIVAVGVELTYTKNQILTMYFNQVGYGGAIYGVEEASQYYFGKSIKDATLAESALLAGLPASPTIYSPFGANPELAIARQHEVLRRMVEEGYATQEQSDIAQAEKLKFISPRNNIIAPHFVMFVKNELVNKFGESLVHQGGLEVTTTLDRNIQAEVEKIVKEQMAKIKNLHATNASVLVTNPQTGEILAMVGSVDYFDIENDGQVNVVTRPRQPGSSIKPLTYALAFENGMKTTAIIDDSPITYRVPGSPPYSPINYDGKYHGKVTARQALANSYNIPAVKVLSQIGLKNFIDFAISMGITTWNDPTRFGLSLTLGGGEVKMIDLATAYGVFANGGKKVEIYSTSHIADYKDNLILSRDCANQRIDKPVVCMANPVIKPQTAYFINDILADNKARSNTFGTNSKLVIPGHQVSVKTGTTNNLRDNWTIGYTSKYLVAVWVGNNDNTPMSGVASGITGATPIWQEIMKKLLANTTTQTLNQPENMVKVNYCPLTQTLSCKECPNPVEEFFTEGEQPKTHCTQDLVERFKNPPKDTLPRNQILEGVSTD